jgi:hypothetical protein
MDRRGTNVHTIELPVARVRQIALLTAYDAYATQMLARTLLPNGKLIADKLPITEQAMLAFVNWESVARHIAFLCHAGQYDEASATWDRTGRNATLRADTYAALQRMAPSTPGLGAWLAKLPAPPAAPAGPQVGTR